MKVQFNTDEFKRNMEGKAKQIAYAAMLAVNKTAEQARSELRTEMGNVFDRPTPWALNSLRIKYATKARPEAEIAYKDKNTVESSRTIIEPHVTGGSRDVKPMETRLQRAGFMPSGWVAIPGAGADFDAFGNMSRGQISTILNVLGTYKEAGYSKADSRTVARLKKGTKKAYGFEYFPVRPGDKNDGGLRPGIYKKTFTAFGTSVTPVLVFAKGANYKPRLDFYGICQRVKDRDIQSNFKEALEMALRTERIE